MRRVRLSWFLLLLLPTGCGIYQRGDVIYDAEIKADGKWTAKDQLARDLLRREAGQISDKDLRAHIANKTVRRSSVARKFVDFIRLGDQRIPFPRITALTGLGFLFGTRYEERHTILPSQNAWIFFHRERAPTVIAFDPDKPIGEEEKTPARLYNEMRDALERDLEKLSPKRPDLQP